MEYLLDNAYCTGQFPINIHCPVDSAYCIWNIDWTVQIANDLGSENVGGWKYHATPELE